LKAANLEGLRQLPVQKFLREYNQIAASEAGVAQAEREQAEIAAEHEIYLQADAYMNLFGKQFNSAPDRGSEPWIERARAWRAENPPPNDIAAQLLYQKVRHAQHLHADSIRIKAEQADAIANADVI
jgi:hypothetical protein